MVKRKYGKPKKRELDQRKVKRFLAGLGFTTELMRQEWRHLLVFGEFQGKKAVFKLASTQTTSAHTQNEYYWNKAVHLVPKDKHPNFTVPENYHFGHFGKLFYFIAERFLGKPYLEGDADEAKKIIPKIPQIAKATFELENLSIPLDCEFAQTKKSGRQKKIPVGQRLLLSATEWANQVPKNLDSFLKVIEKSKDNLRTCVGHGDFVIRQMYDVGGKTGIIDGEHAGLKGPLYYDVAQFYIRLRNDHQGKEAAKKYLKEFKSLLPASDKQNLWKELKPVLIQRYIGDLWGAAQKPEKLETLAALGKEILTDRII